MSDLDVAKALNKLYAWKGEPGWWDQGDMGQGDHGICWAARRAEDGVTDIYLRGSVTPLDWFRDFLAAAYQPFGHAEMGPVHAGFYIGMPEVWTAMKRCLDPPFRVSGHSLGAGRAAILTALMTLDGATPQRRVCFGEPRPGMAQLGKLIAPVPTASYRNGDTFHHDYVTDVPFELRPLLPYVHPVPLIMVNAPPGSAGPQEDGVFAWHHMPLYELALVHAGIK